jgi:hypothetical protein
MYLAGITSTTGTHAHTHARLPTHTYISALDVYEYIYCHVSGLCVTYRRILDWMIGFDTLYTPLGTTGNYSAIAISTLYRSL